MTIEGTSPLYQALSAAFDANDARTFNKLIEQHLNDILAEFSSWQKVPAAISTDEAAASRYIHCLIAIAQAADALGEPALIEKLVGPIGQWNRRLSRAQALSDAGEYAESNNQLREVLAEMKGATGNAIVNLRPTILGRLGFNALHEQEYAAALDYMSQAYEASTDAKDEEGLALYYENLTILRVIDALHTDPERGRRLIAARRLVAQAQDLTDTGRYQASINLLSQADFIIQSQGEDELLRALLPKIHGLLGFDEYKLGHTGKAEEYTALAQQESAALGDTDGIRIYSANLEWINKV
jgi:tetratricopeptide (TPR) repeat protein